MRKRKGVRYAKPPIAEPSDKIIDSFGDHASACSAANLMTSKRAQIVERAIMLMAKRAGVEAEAQPSSEGLTGGRLSGRQLQALFPKGAKVSGMRQRNQLALKLCEENQGPEQESTRKVVEQMAEQQRRETTGGQPLTFDIILKDDEEQKAYLIDHAVVHSTAATYEWKHQSAQGRKKKSVNRITNEQNIMNLTPAMRAVYKTKKARYEGFCQIIKKLESQTHAKLNGEK